MIVIVTIKGLVIPKHLFVIVMKLGLNLKIVQVRKKILITAKCSTNVNNLIIFLYYIYRFCLLKIKYSPFRLKKHNLYILNIMNR